MATSTTDVADDIVPLILSFLPPKSLLRFRSVCRSWRDMISDPGFLRMHLDQSKKRLSQNLFVRIAAGYYPDEVSPHTFSSVRVGDQGFQPEADLGSPAGDARWTSIECTCDGVMLIQDFSQRYMLWNPFTQKKAFFPKHPHKFYASSHFGICYDPKTMDDFKVVAISNKYYTVHSCKSGSSWSDKKAFPYNTIDITPGPGIFADGAIYWVVRNGEGLREIVWFDRNNDDFKTLPRPEQVEAGVEFELVMMRGCLCLYYQTGGEEFHVWVVKDHKKTCWEELIVVENVQQCLGPVRRLKPLCILENNNIVIRCGWRYVEYKTFRQFEVMTRSWIMAPCVQSLLFPSTKIFLDVELLKMDNFLI